eukprot:TRINITY_DN25483_c0_g1_i2.p1 TRINITY_DN25483_c0_g1~~TRINITY_DN25483_c0_g1_i2.p1  ORF type:complete len:281 (+),score=59.75 TRINITY_DN25483_c0_g1_i2:145-987(+)
MRSTYRSSLEHTRDTIDAYFGKHKPESLMSPAHTPPVIDKVVTAELHAALGKHFDRLLAAQMRTARDFEPNFGLSWFVQGHAPPAPNGFSYRHKHLGFPTRALHAAAAATESGVAGNATAVMPHLSIGNALCRVAGRAREGWGEAEADIVRRKLGTECARAASAPSSGRWRRGAASGWGRLDAGCRGRLLRAAAATAFSWRASSKGETLFQMMRPSTSMRKLLKRLEDGQTTVACLNDDFPADGPDAPANAMLELLETLYPEKAAWELYEDLSWPRRRRR